MTRGIPWADGRATRLGRPPTRMLRTYRPTASRAAASSHPAALTQSGRLRRSDIRSWRWPMTRERVSAALPGQLEARTMERAIRWSLLPLSVMSFMKNRLAS